jgi:hypothetical protein
MHHDTQAKQTHATANEERQPIHLAVRSLLAGRPIAVAADIVAVGGRRCRAIARNDGRAGGRSTVSKRRLRSRLRCCRRAVLL